MADPQLTRVKSYPNLSDAALAQGRDREYRVWLLARFLDPQGSGRVAIAELQELAKRQRMRGLSPSCVCRLLQRGEGTFWTVYSDHGRRYLKLQGLANVCEALGAERLRANPVYIELRYLRSLRAFRAACLYSRFAGDKPTNPISRRTLHDITGVKPRTQRSYARALGRRLKIKQNAATTSKKWKPGDEIPIEDDEIPGSYFVDYVDGETRVLRRLPNSYLLTFPVAPRGMMRKVNRRLRGKASRIEGEAEQSSNRLFYRNRRAAHRRMQQAVEGDWFYNLGGDVAGAKTVKRSRCGAVLWTQNRISNGAVICG